MSADVPTCTACGRACPHCMRQKRRDAIRAEFGTTDESSLDARMAEMRADGHSLREIGDLVGLTAERVRQRINSFAPWAHEAGAQVRAHLLAQARERAANEEAEVREARARERAAACITCGAPTRKNRDADDNATCSADCNRIYRGLLNHLREPRQYIRPGSASHATATEAWRRSLPIFGLLPDNIQRQIRGGVPPVPSYHHLRRASGGAS